MLILAWLLTLVGPVALYPATTPANVTFAPSGLAPASAGSILPRTASSGVLGPTVIRATGIGRADPHTHGDRARLMAEQAARMVALRNLLVRLNQPATAPASQPASGRIQINGVLRGYRFLPTRFLPDGTAEVTVELPLISQQTAPAPSAHPGAHAASMPGSSESFLLRENGTIPVWVIAGPFPNAHITDHGQACFGYFTDYLKDRGGEAEVSPFEGDRVAAGSDQSVTWKAAFSKPSGLLDYRELLATGSEMGGVAYAFCRLDADAAKPALLKIRSNDGVRVWLNGQMVHDHHLGRSIDSGEDQVAIALQKGPNRLLVKVDQGGGDWGLLVLLRQPDGSPLPGVMSAVNVNDPIGGRIVSIRLTPALICLNTPDPGQESAILEVVSGGLKSATCRIAMKCWPQPWTLDIGDLPVGETQVQIRIPPITQSGPAAIELRSSTIRREFIDVPVTAPRPWLVYLVQHTHTDIGYTRPQSEMLAEHLRFIDYALDCCDATDDYPDDAKFRWTCEVSWTVREYFARRPARQIERFKKRVAEGRIEVTGMFVNMSEISTESSLAASLQPVREFKDAGIPVRLAMQNDVNGAAWCLVDYFQEAGIKYLTMGINATRSLLAFDRPTAFWWESPAGRRILAFRPDHYHIANLKKIHEGNLEVFEGNLSKYLGGLQRAGYPFDRISMQYSGYFTDNSPPATSECDLIKAWNSKYSRPKLRIATASEFLDYLATQHADELPVYRQAWPDWWTDGFGSAARETAASRQAHADMLATQGLLAIAALTGEPPRSDTTARTMAVHDAITFYDEHTFGSSLSVEDPTVESTMVQWGQKGSYAWDGVKQAAMLREEAVGALQHLTPQDHQPRLTVFNTLNWTRSGMVAVFIELDLLGRGVKGRFVDEETKEELAAQPFYERPEGTFWSIWAKDVPPLGCKRYRIERAGTWTPPAPPDPAKRTIENAWYRLTVDASAGAVDSLFDKELGRELIEKQSPWRLGQLIYERIEGGGREFLKDAFRRTSVRNASLQPGLGGPVYKSIALRADLDGFEPNSVRVEIRLYEAQKRLELCFDARKLPVRQGEGVYVAFPFQWAGGKLVYEAQGGMVTPGENQIHRSSSDWQTVQNFAALRGNDGQIIWGSTEIPLVQFGDLNCGKWQTTARLANPFIYSWVMNNYWFTNFRATQEGQFKWSYYLTSAADPSNATATRFGWGSRVPLVARVLPPGKSRAWATGSSPASPTSLLECKAPNLLLAEARPAWHGPGIILQWREVEGRSATFDLADQPFAPHLRSADEVNVLEEVIKADCRSLSFAPREVKFLRLSFK
jgi:hypothetical protein